MTDDKKYEEAFGLDIPFDEALQRFAVVRKEELAEGPESQDLVPEGEVEIVRFKDRDVRRICRDGEWLFSIVDVIGSITETDRASKYWTDLKAKMERTEGFKDISDNIGSIPLPTADGRMRGAEVANAEVLFRIIQSIASPKAEPVKRWLAKVAYERIQEIQDPEIGIKRAILSYQIQGRSDDWIEKRVRSIVTNKELNREWQKRGISEHSEFAMLTNVIAQETFGVGVARHKRVKGLGSQNLRDHMTDLELILTMLGETSANTIAKQRDTYGLTQNAEAARAGGGVAGTARRQIEKETGQPVVSKQNFLGSRQRKSDPVRLTEGGKRLPSDKPAD